MLSQAPNSIASEKTRSETRSRLATFSAMRGTILLFLLGFLAFSCLALSLLAGMPPWQISNAANTKFPTDTQHKDLGKLSIGEAPEWTFLFDNTSNKSLKILTVRKSCGCQDVNISEGLVVEAGANLPITYSLSKRRSGKQSGTLVITTDSDEIALKQVVFSLAADRPRAITATPRVLRFYDAGPNQLDLVIRSEIEDLLDFYSGASTSKELVEMSLVERTPTSLRFLVTLAKRPSTADAFDLITLAFKHPEHRQLIVRVHREGRHLGSAVDD